MDAEQGIGRGIGIRAESLSQEQSGGESVKSQGPAWWEERNA